MSQGNKQEAEQKQTGRAGVAEHSGIHKSPAAQVSPASAEPLAGIPWKLVLPAAALVVLFVAGVLWRVDEALYSDRAQWLEFQLRTQVQAIEQNFLAELKFWQTLPAREYRNWPQIIASTEVGHWDEAWSWSDFQWGPLSRKEALIKKLKSLPTPVGLDQGAASGVAFSAFVDLDQKPRGLVWVKQDSKIFLVVVSIEKWHSWVSAFQGNKAELFIINNEGLALAHLQKEYLGQKMTEHPIFKEMSAKKDLQLLVRALPYPDRQSYSVVALRLRGSNLILAAASPMNDVMLGRSTLRWQILILGCGVLLLLLGSLVILNSTSARGKSAAQEPGMQLGAHPSPAASPGPAGGVGIPGGGTATATAGSGSGFGAGSERLLAEEKIKIYKSIAAAVGHELRGPLSSILANAQLIPHGDVNTQEALRNILKETREARATLDKVLGFSGQTVRDKVDMKLESPVRKVLKKWEGIFKAKNINLTAIVEDNHLRPIDQEPLMKALENILLNAVDAMERKLEKNLSVSVKSEGQSSVIVIEDNGQGMDETVLGKAKDPFYTTRSYAHHLGLGLSEAEGIFRQHQAEMKIFSQPGKGSRVEIRFAPVSATGKGKAGLPLAQSLPPAPISPETPAKDLLGSLPKMLKVTPTLSSAPAQTSPLLPPAPPEDINDMFELSPPSAPTPSLVPLSPEAPEQTITQPIPQPNLQPILQPIPQPIPQPMTQSMVAPVPAFTPPQPAALTPKLPSPPEPAKLTAPSIAFEKPASPLDTYKVSVRKPGQRSS